MAIVPNMMATALGLLGVGVGQTLQYRVNAVGAWTALPNSFLLPTPPIQLGMDEQHNAILAPQQARLKVAVGSVHLIPGSGGVAGAQVKDQLNVVWAVIGVDHSVGQSIYLLQRAPVQSQGPARGGTP